MKKLLEYADRYNMLPEGTKVICALSGGADSVCLLDMLRCAAEERNIELYAAHFNHRLRGAESDRDEAFSRELCAKMGVRFFFSGGDVAAFARENRLGTEEAARKLRYAFFEALAEKLPGARVATAHNADDNAETLLLNLSRGTGLKGLAGIPPVRGIFIRPLLCHTRKEIVEYLEKRGLEHIEDSTNIGDAYARNRLRHAAMPALRSVNPECSALMLECAERVREDESLLMSIAQEKLTLEEKNGRMAMSASELRAAPRPLSSRIVRTACEHFGVHISASHAEAVLSLAESSPSAILPLPGGLRAERRYDELLVGRALPAVELSERELTWNSWTELPEISSRVFFGEKDKNSDNNGETFLFKRAELCGKITVRPRREGDSIGVGVPPMGKSLKKLFIDRKIPAASRKLVPIFCDELGIIAAAHIGRNSKRFRGGGGDCVICLVGNK